MGARINQLRNLSILAVASALLGCASVPTTNEYALAHGWLPTQIKGREYFCSGENVVPGVPRTDCLTRTQVIGMRYWNWNDGWPLVNQRCGDGTCF